MDAFADFWCHTVTVTPGDADGDTDDYGRPIPSAPVQVSAWVEEDHTMVRGPGGVETLSTATVTTPWEAPRFPVGSTVSLPDGRDSTVLTVTAVNGAPVDLPSIVVYRTS